MKLTVEPATAAISYDLDFDRMPRQNTRKSSHSKDLLNGEKRANVCLGGRMAVQDAYAHTPPQIPGW